MPAIQHYHDGDVTTRTIIVNDPVQIDWSVYGRAAPYLEDRTAIDVARHLSRGDHRLRCTADLGPGRFARPPCPDRAEASIGMNLR